VDIDEIRREVEGGGCILMYVAEVEKLHEGGGHDGRVLVVTDCWIGFYRGSVRSHVYAWMGLTDAAFGEGVVCFFFGTERLAFETDDVESIKRMFGFILQRVFTKGEAKHFHPHRLTSVKHGWNERTVMSRMMMHAIQHRVDIDGDLMDQVRRIAETKREVIQLCRDQRIGKLIPSILFGLQQKKDCLSLHLPAYQKSDHFRVLGTFLSNSHHLCHISVAQRSHKNFSEFCDGLKEQKGKRLSGLSLEETSLTSKNIVSLREAYEVSGMTSFFYSGPLKPADMSQLMSNFFSERINRQLKMVGFSRNCSLDVEAFLPQFSALSILVLSDCQLNIPDVLPHLEGLVMVDLSGNFFGREVKAEDFERVRGSLKRLDVNRVDFGGDCLESLLRVLGEVEFEELKALSCNEISFQGARFFNAVRNLPNIPISWFSWCNNEVSDEFFEFLGRQRGLQSLFLNGCIGREVDSLVNCISSLHQLRDLSLKGDREHQIGESFCQVLEGMRSLKRLRFLDISWNGIGDEGVCRLSEAIGSMELLSELVFDGSEVDDMRTIENVFKAVIETRRPFVLDWPMEYEIKGIDYRRDLLKVNPKRCWEYGGIEGDPFEEGFGFYKVGEYNEFPKYYGKKKDLRERKIMGGIRVPEWILEERKGEEEEDNYDEENDDGMNIEGLIEEIIGRYMRLE